jgi:hypothetical protein
MSFSVASSRGFVVGAAHNLSAERTAYGRRSLPTLGLMNPHDLRRTIEQEIDSYVYQRHPQALGTPMPQEWVKQQLTEMRAALVDPVLRSVQIRDSVAQIRGEEPPSVRDCFLVADDNEGYELYFDPTSNDFVLAYSGDPPSTFNVRGDAVGCFMAR